MTSTPTYYYHKRGKASSHMHPGSIICSNLENEDSEHDFYGLSTRRNVWVQDASGSTVAGLIQTGSVTIKTFYRWLGMILVIDEQWFLRSVIEENTLFRGDTSILMKGVYTIVNSDGSSLSSQPISIPRIRRLISPGNRTPPTAADERFVEKVAERDKKCCVSAIRYVCYKGSRLLTAAQIFPLAYYEEWLSPDWYKEIQVDRNFKNALNALDLFSPRNGIILNISVQKMFDSYQIAVDVEDNYRLVELSPIRYLDPDRDSSTLIRDVSAPSDQQPSDVLLREHFRQALIQFVLGDGNDPGDEWQFELRKLLNREEIFDLSETKWTYGVGKQIIERYLATKIFGCLPEVIEHVSNGTYDESLRWNSERRLSILELKTPPVEQEEPFESAKSGYEQWLDYISHNDGKSIPLEKIRQFKGDHDPFAHFPKKPVFSTPGQAETDLVSRPNHYEKLREAVDVDWSFGYPYESGIPDSVFWKNSSLNQKTSLAL